MVPPNCLLRSIKSFKSVSIKASKASIMAGSSSFAGAAGAGAPGADGGAAAVVATPAVALGTPVFSKVDEAMSSKREVAASSLIASLVNASSGTKAALNDNLRGRRSLSLLSIGGEVLNYRLMRVVRLCMLFCAMVAVAEGRPQVRNGQEQR